MKVYEVEIVEKSKLEGNKSQYNTCHPWDDKGIGSVYQYFPRITVIIFLSNESSPLENNRLKRKNDNDDNLFLLSCNKCRWIIKTSETGIENKNWKEGEKERETETESKKVELL